jgi:hypothetical protein
LTSNHPIAHLHSHSEGMRKAFSMTAAVLAAVVLFWLWTLPPNPVSLPPVDPALASHIVPGAFHVHTNRSDGAAAPAEVAAAARRAGLRFVIFTDHGDATRPPDPPAYIEGVLCLDAVEISTSAGHYFALDTGAAPYRLGGEASAVVEDVRRLGGFGVAAHPSSPKAELAWTDWTAGVDGLEWLNGDSEWRDESRVRLARAAADYLIRPPAAVASLFDRPIEALARWDALSAERPVVAVAGHDAHGGARAQDTAGIRGIPSYEAAFGAFAVRAIVDEPLAAEAAGDAHRIVSAIRSGHLFTAIDAIATPAALEFVATRPGARAAMGETLHGEGAASFSVRAALPPGAEIVLLRNGHEISTSRSPTLTVTDDRTGAFRVEMRVAGAPGSPPVPWVVTNPIYVGLPPTPGPQPASPADLHDLRGPWRLEKDPASEAASESAAATARLTYRLSETATSPFAALVVPLPDPAPEYNAIVLDVTSRSPARIFVQLRFDRDGGQRAIKSIYVSSERRVQVVKLSELRAAERNQPAPDFRRAASLLLVADLVNSVPGASGAITVHRVALATVR